MRIRFNEGLPFITASLVYHDRRLSLENVLLDTGSAGTIISTEKVLSLGLVYEEDDLVHRIRGVGGAEFVYTKKIDCLSIGELQARDFDIEVGAMDYGFILDGIIGMDFFIRVGAIIDLANLEIYQVKT